MTRYREAFTWTDSIDAFVKWNVTETPLLNVCAGASDWGDTTMDLYEPADVQGDWTALPFATDSFGAVFADPPWDSGHKREVAAFVREALRVAPVAYLMAPWLYCAAWAKITRVWFREFPGVNTPILLSRYERPRQLHLFIDGNANYPSCRCKPDCEFPCWQRFGLINEPCGPCRCAPFDYQPIAVARAALDTEQT